MLTGVAVVQFGEKDCKQVLPVMHQGLLVPDPDANSTSLLLN